MLIAHRDHQPALRGPLRPSRRRAIALAAAASLGLLTAPAAWAASKTVDCTSTSWTAASCWNPDGVPIATDTVHVLPVGTSATTLSISTGTTAAAASLDVDSTSGTLAQISMSGGTLTLSGAYMVGVSGSGLGSHSGGTLTATSLQVGPYAGSSGTFTFSGASSAMNLSQLYVGLRGDGSLTLGSGAVTLSSQLVVGYFDTSANARIVQNGGTLGSPSSFVGVDGNATFEQAAGTHAVASSLYLGYGPAGQGSYSLSGGTLSSANTYVGRAGTGSMTQSNGSFTTGTLMLGQLSGSSGSYTLNGGRLTIASIQRGQGSSGFYWNGGTLEYTSTLEIALGQGLGGSVTVGANKTLLAPTIVTGGGGTLAVSGGRVTAGTVLNDGHVTLSAGSIDAATAFTNSGRMTLSGGDVLGDGSFINDGTVIGAGAILMGGPFNNRSLLRPEGGRLSIDGSSVVNTGIVEVPAGGQMALSRSWSNEGQVQMSGGTLSGVGTFANNANGLLTGYGTVASPVVNQGQITVSGGSLVVGNTLGNSGIVHLAGAGTQLAGSGLFTNTGTVQGAGNIAKVMANSGTLEAIGGTLSFSALSNTNTANGILVAGAGAKLLMTQGLATNAGLIQLDGGTYDNGGVAMANTGRIVGFGNLRAATITNSNQISFSFGPSSITAPITNQAGAKLIVSNGAQATFASNLVNAGELRVSAGGAANFFGLVSGAGAINGTGQIRFEGGYSPGGSPALVTINPDVTIGTGSTVLMELGGTIPGACDDCHDKVIFNGTVKLEGGPLQVVWWNGYQGKAGDAFDLFDWNGGLNGTFGSIELPALTTGLTWQTGALYTDGLLSVVAVPEPASWVLMLLGAAGLLIWRRPGTA